MDKNYIVFLLGVLILVVALGVLLTKSKNESYTNSSDQPLLKLSQCGRNMVFPNFSSANLAAHRAADDNELTGAIGGTCNFPNKKTVGLSDGHETYSVIRDNYIFYALKRSCMAVRYRSFTVEGNHNRVTFEFDTNNSTNKTAFIYFVLLNPLFVEFNKNTEKTTVSYYPIFDMGSGSNSVSNVFTLSKVFRYTNFSDTVVTRYGVMDTLSRNPRITFSVVLPQTERGQDSMFNYFTETNPFVRVQDLRLPTSGTINMAVYYLDDEIPTSYQNVGKTLHSPGFSDMFMNPALLDSNRRSLMVFRNDYVSRYQSNNQATALYHFNNNIAVFYNNYIQPVFTFCFDFLITDRNINSSLGARNIVLVRTYMDNNYGNYTTCDRVTDELDGTRNNNIMMIVLEAGDPNTNGYNLVFASSKGDSCNYPASDKSILTLPLPVLKDTTMMRVVFTLTPNEKIAVGMWKNVGSPPERYVTLARSTHCSNDLNLYRMFRDKNRPSNIVLRDIRMNVNPTYVRSTYYVSLGYANFLREYNKY